MNPDKPRFTTITDADEAAALILNGKYREGERPHFTHDKDGKMRARVDDQLRLFRERRATSAGKEAVK